MPHFFNAFEVSKAIYLVNKLPSNALSIVWVMALRTSALDSEVKVILFVAQEELITGDVINYFNYFSFNNINN